jgi:hypothetical protein
VSSEEDPWWNCMLVLKGDLFPSHGQTSFLAFLLHKKRKKRKHKNLRLFYYLFIGIEDEPKIPKITY